jgi:large subunit ribosomal protein L24
MTAKKDTTAHSKAKAPSMKVKKGDTVVVLSGKDKGAKQRGAQSGGIVTQEAPIHVSNVMVIDSEDKPTRVGYRKDEEGRSIRVSRRTGKDL